MKKLFLLLLLAVGAVSMGVFSEPVNAIDLCSLETNKGQCEKLEQCEWVGNGKNAFCQQKEVNPVCGNTVEEGDEVCDRGEQNGVVCEPVYGGEDCDYCSEGCDELFVVKASFCGDGTKDLGQEECDLGELNTDGPFQLGYGEEVAFCSTNCTEEVAKGPYCGDGTTQEVYGEECDDGNEVSGDGCDLNCKVEPAFEPMKLTSMCGNGDGLHEMRVRNPNTYSLEYAWKIAGGGASGTGVALPGDTFFFAPQGATVIIEYYVDDVKYSQTKAQNTNLCSCGDGRINYYSETCDNGQENAEGCEAGYGDSCEYCSLSCTVEEIKGPYCGDGEVNGEEECDGGKGCLENCLWDEEDNVCIVDGSPFIVEAIVHTLADPLFTNLLLEAGDHLVIDVASDDTWSAGVGDRTSNADGLVVGNPYGGTYPLYNGFPYGALVGQIGEGAYFLIGTSFDGIVNESGELKLMYRDSNYGDNIGDVSVEIYTDCVDENSCVVPKVGTVGVDQTFGSNYIVCRADEQSARVAHNDVGGNFYNALEVCQTLGYTTMTAWGGTCGTICGYCGTPGNEYYDGAGYQNANSLRYTVHRRCEGLREECVDQPDPYCGDGIVNQESEQCDNGHGLDMEFVKVSMEEGFCNDECQWEEVYEPYCGNGVLDEDEECDDGNTENGDGCDNECERESKGGGSARSVRGQGPRTLLETGPDDDAGNEPTAATEETVIAACEEDTYILERLGGLSSQSMEIVHVIPGAYAKKLGTKAMMLSNRLMLMLRAINDPEQRNEMIRNLVCKIEMMKEQRGLRHAHIGYKSGYDEMDYLLQYLQDLAILEFTK